MINEWNLNDSFLDTVQCADLTPVYNPWFVLEDDGNYSIQLNSTTHSHLRAQPGVYFSGDFSISAWIYVTDILTTWRVLDFGNGASNQNVILSYSDSTKLITRLLVSNGSNVSPFSALSTFKYSLQTWTHLAATLNGSQARLYLNGTSSGTGQLPAPIKLVRNSNLIGKTNWQQLDYTSARFRNIRIFNRALSQNEIANDMNNLYAGL